MEGDPPDDGRWFDLWHVHPEAGDAAERWVDLAAAWAGVEATGRASGRPWQSWLVIDPADAREDAAYLHTPNPNRDNYPYRFEGVSWGVEAPDWLAGAVDPLVTELGRSEYGGAALYWARRISTA